MATTFNLRKLLHRKAWEFATPCTVNTGAGSWIDSDKTGVVPGADTTYFVAGTSSIFNYNHSQDAWLQLPSSGAAGAFGAGSCGEFLHIGMLGGSSTSTATAGTTNSLTTNRTIVKDITGSIVRVVSGTGLGYEGTVTSVTYGANAKINVSPANGVAFDATTTFEVYSGSLWFFNAGSTAVGFSVYDRATNSWTAKSVTGLPTAWGINGQLIGTPGTAASFITGTGIAGSTSTTLNTNKTLLLNQVANYQVRITAGTGKGQVRVITSNTAGVNSVLTVPAWTVTPDVTSVYSIEGDSNSLYLFGNNAVTAYKYSISGNTWVTLAPTAARAGAQGAGGTADWIEHVEVWNESTIGNNHYLTTIQQQNGRYIYSFRGAGSSTLDIYDIALNTWVSGVAYGNQLETFNTGSCSVDNYGIIYLQKEGTGRIFRFDIAKHTLEAYATNIYMQSNTVEGDKMFLQAYKDGATSIEFLYSQMHSRAELVRIMDI